MLYNRIEERIDLMLSQGLVDEVAAPADKGFARTCIHARAGL